MPNKTVIASEAKQSALLDCFVAALLAMTDDRAASRGGTTVIALVDAMTGRGFVSGSKVGHRQ